MSKTKYKWWGYVKCIIRAYPDHCRDLADLQIQSITPAYGDIAHGSGGVSKPVENLVLATLPIDEQKEYEAVEKAIQQTKQLRDGAEHLRLIDLVYFRKSHDLEGAALMLNVSYATAKRWHSRFIVTVARFHGLLHD